ncbi:MAG: PrsW family intramembrane metalloprotease [Bacteroidales bacterium]|nr:PrsW family intramembrane metalloprotease [Bacteroidales bacterium]
MVQSTSNIVLSIVLPLVIIALLVGIMHIRFKFKSLRNVMRAIGFGAVSIIFLLLFDFIAGLLGLDRLSNLKRSAFYSFAVVGFAAEFGKFVFLRYYFSRLKSFSSPLDGVIYSLLLSMGFTLVALPLFVAGVFSNPVSVQFLYSYSFANLAFAIVLGFFVGMGIFRKNRFIDSMTGLGAASFFHGFFYFANLTSDYTILLLYGGGLSIIALLLLIKSFNSKNFKA